MSLDWDWEALRAIALREAQFVLHDADRAHDAAQEAAIRAWCSADACRRIESPGPWIRTIARREALRIAARQEQAAEEGNLIAVEEHGDVEARIDIQRALAGLKPLDRRLIVEHYWAAMSYGAIASGLGLPTGTVKTRLHRARRALRAALPAYPRD